LARSEARTKSHDVELVDQPEAIMEVAQHRHDTIADVILHAGAGGKRLVIFRVDDQHMPARRYAGESLAQLLQHRDVEDIERRIGERDAVGIRVGGDGDLRHS
jgi:hypothetical protein